MAGFLTSNSVSLANGSDTIYITGSVDCSQVYSGTAVFIDGELLEGIEGTEPDISGNSTITLRYIYTGTTLTNSKMIVFNTIEGLRDAIEKAGAITEQYEDHLLTVVDIVRGGTGATTVEGVRDAFSLYSKAQVDLAIAAIAPDPVLPISKGGTGSNTAVGARANLDVYSKSQISTFVSEQLSANVPAVTPISKGGTGSTTAAGARSNLSIYSKGEIDDLLDAEANISESDFARGFNNVDEMIAYPDLVVGNRYSTGGTTWVCKSLPSTDIYSFRALTDIHVTDFGAVGDGVADDSDPIQNALIAANYADTTCVVRSNARMTHKITKTIEVRGYHVCVNLGKAKVKVYDNFTVFKIIQCHTFGMIDFYSYADVYNWDNKAVQIGKSYSDTFTHIGDATNLTLRIHDINFETTWNTGIYSEIELDNSKIDNIRTWAIGDWGNAVIDVRGNNPVDRSRSVGLDLTRIHIVANPTTANSPQRKMTGIRMKSTEHSLIDAIVNNFDVTIDLDTPNPRCPATYNNVMYITLQLHKDITLSTATFLSQYKTHNSGSYYTVKPSRYSPNSQLGYWFECTQTGYVSNGAITNLDITGAEFTIDGAKFKCRGFECLVKLGNTQGATLLNSYVRSNGLLFSQNTYDESIGICVSGGIVDYENGIIYNRSTGGYGSFSIKDGAWAYGFASDINMDVTIEAGCKLKNNGVLDNGFLKVGYNNRAVVDTGTDYETVTITETTTVTTVKDIIIGDLAADIQILFSGIPNGSIVNIINMNTNRNRMVEVFSGNKLDNLVNYKDKLTIIWGSDGKIASQRSEQVGFQEVKYTAPTGDITLTQNLRQVFIHDLSQDITVYVNRDLDSGTQTDILLINPSTFKVFVRGTHGFWGNGVNGRIAGVTLDTHGDWAITNNWRDQKSYIRSNKTVTDPWV